MSKTLNVYLQRRKARQLVGKLFREGKKFVFEYEESYRLSPKPLRLGPDIPLDRARHSSLKLFPSFKDRLPSRQNPAYESYCRSNGISPKEKDPLVLLGALGREGPGSFIVAKAPPSHNFSNLDLKKFRESLGLSIREFSSLFEVSPAGLYRVENGRSSGIRLLKQIKLYKDRPETALHKLKSNGAVLNNSKRQFVEYKLKSQLGRFNTGRGGPWAVKAKDIQECNSNSAVELLRRLLLAECFKYNIPQSQVHVSSNITAPDGGRDGLVADWACGGIERTNYLPKRHNCFQMKATALKPSECEKEMFDKKGGLKPAILNMIKKRGAYILCSTHPCAGVHISLREEKLQEALEKATEKNPALKNKLPSIEIKFYDADILADWLNSHPPTALWFLREVCQKPISPSWRSWSSWSTDALEEPTYRLSRKLEEKKQQVYKYLLQPRSVVHLTGAGGLGKTRLAFEAFRPEFEKGGRLKKPDLSHLILYSLAEELSPKDIRELKPSRAILIIDDCTARQAEAFRQAVCEGDSQLSLLTIAWPEGSLLSGGGTKPPRETASAGFLKDGPANSSGASPKNFSPAITSPNLGKACYCEIKLEPDKEIAKQILADSPNIKNRYFQPLALRLCQGWPLMAKLLMEIGPDELMKGNVPFNPFGRGDKDPSALKAIKACALFDTLCIEDEKPGVFHSSSHRGESESRYIAQAISKLDYETFYSKVQFFKKKQIIQQTGRFIQVRPKPLALWLAVEFIRESPPESVLQWLGGGMGQSGKTPLSDKLLAEATLYKGSSPGNTTGLTQQGAGKPEINDLREAFCRQIASFPALRDSYQGEGGDPSGEDDFSLLLKETTEKLISSEGLFGHPKALNTEWGSSCFFYLAKLCPKAALRTLENVLGGKSPEGFKNPLAKLTQAPDSQDFVVRESQKNGIWVLQALSARKKFYDRSIRLLLKFALAEQGEESILQYAMPIFTGHFQLFGSGTEAGPDQKFRIIREIIRSPKPTFQEKSVALKALGEALKAENFTDRTSTIEEFWGRGFVNEWRPKTYGEIWGYYRQALSLLTDLALNSNALGENKGFLEGNYPSDKQATVLKGKPSSLLKKTKAKGNNQEDEQGNISQKEKESSDDFIKEEACRILDKNLRSLLRPALFEGIWDDLEKSIRELISIHEPFRVLVYEALKKILKYDSKKGNYEDKDLKRIEKLLASIEPESLEKKIKLYVSEYPYGFFEDEKTYREKFNKLCAEFETLIRKALSEKARRPRQRSRQEQEQNQRQSQGREQSKEKEQRQNQNQEQQSQKEALSALKALFQGDQNKTFDFAKQFAKVFYPHPDEGFPSGNLPKKVESERQILDFINIMLKNIKKWRSNKNFNPDFLGGFFAGLYKHDPKNGDLLLDRMAQDPVLRSFLLLLYSDIPALRDRDIQRLTQLVKSKKLDIEENSYTGWAMHCQNVRPELMLDLMKAVSNVAPLFALQIHNCYYETMERQSPTAEPLPSKDKTSINRGSQKIKQMQFLYRLLTDLLSDLSLSQNPRQGKKYGEYIEKPFFKDYRARKAKQGESPDEYIEVSADVPDIAIKRLTRPDEYTQAVQQILNSSEFGEKFALFFFKNINIADTALGGGNTKICCEEALKKYPDVLLKAFSDIQSDKTAQMLFSSQDLTWAVNKDIQIPESSSPLSVLSDRQLKELCRKAPGKMPVFLARYVSLFSYNKEEGRLTWSAFARFLFEEYGNKIELTQALNCNIFTFSWSSGSRVVFLERLKSACEELSQRRHSNIRDFAHSAIEWLEERIRHERIRDAERREFDI